MRERAGLRPIVFGGVLLGMGLGGFFDGIVLHQVLQWHHMLTSAGYPPTTVANLKLNTLADGLFHVATYIMTALGVALLWSGARRGRAPWSTTLLIGTLLMGWGAFNVLEGVVDHHLLGVHHVRSGPNQAAWDLAFLAWGAAMLLGGYALARAGHQQTGAAANKSGDSVERA